MIMPEMSVQGFRKILSPVILLLECKQFPERLGKIVTQIVILFAFRNLKQSSGNCGDAVNLPFQSKIAGLFDQTPDQVTGILLVKEQRAENRIPDAGFGFSGRTAFGIQHGSVAAGINELRSEVGILRCQDRPDRLSRALILLSPTNSEMISPARVSAVPTTASTVISSPRNAADDSTVTTGTATRTAR